MSKLLEEVEDFARELDRIVDFDLEKEIEMREKLRLKMEFGLAGAKARALGITREKYQSFQQARAAILGDLTPERVELHVRYDEDEEDIIIES